MVVALHSAGNPKAATMTADTARPHYVEAGRRTASTRGRLAAPAVAARAESTPAAVVGAASVVVVAEASQPSSKEPRLQRLDPRGALERKVVVETEAAAPANETRRKVLAARVARACHKYREEPMYVQVLARIFPLQVFQSMLRFDSQA